MWQLSDWNKEDEKLMSAVERGQTDKVHQLIVRKRLSPFKIDPKRQITALHRAVLDGRVEMIQLILRDGNGSLNTKDLYGRTPLHCAVHSAQYDVTKRLLESGADVLCVDHENRSTLHHACIGGHLGCIQLLLSKSAPVYLKDKDGVCPLTLAASRGQATICRILLENGADVNDVDSRNRTPLIMAAEQGHTALCDYLLTKGAAVQLVDKDGHDADWYAVQNKHRDVVRVLRKKTIPAETKETGGARGSREKVVEEWPFAEHAYEAVTELNEGEGEGGGGEEARREALTKPRRAGVTPSGSSASRERMPSPPIEQSPEAAAAAAHEYSHIEELEQEEPDGEKLRFDGPSSFRSFVDEAFGLNGVTADQSKKVRDSSQVHLQFPQAEEEKERETEAEAEEIEESRRDDDACAVDVRNFMTDSDVTDDVGPIRDDVTGNGSGSRGDDRTSSESDVIVAREIVKSLIEDAVLEASKVPEQSTVVRAEVRGGDSDVKYTEVKFSEYSAEEEKTNGVDSTCAEEASDTQGERISESKALNGDSADRLTSPQETEVVGDEDRTSAWPPFSQLITSESDLGELFQHISDLERENSDLRRELDSVQEDRLLAERAKTELEKKLSLAVNRQHWIHEELCQMRGFIGEAKTRLTGDRSTAEERLRRAAVDVDTLERLVSALVNLRVDAIEDVELYSSLQEMGWGWGSSSSGGEGQEGEGGGGVRMAAAVARLEREKKALLFHLRQAIGENRQLQAQMEEVEKFVQIARELKDENEALIADYRKFREFQEEEVSGMDELAQLFKETLEENRDLQAENEALKVKVVELQGRLSQNDVTGDDDVVARLLQENLQLRNEAAELTKAVNRESQTILEMDERLREWEAAPQGPPRPGGGSPRDSRAEEADAEEEFNSLRHMYDELKEQTVQLLREAEDKAKTQRELERIQEEFEERLAEIVHLRATLDNRCAEIRRLQDERQTTTKQTEAVIWELKRDQDRQTEEQRTRLERALEENRQLKQSLIGQRTAKGDESRTQGLAESSSVQSSFDEDRVISESATRFIRMSSDEIQAEREEFLKDETHRRHREEGGETQQAVDRMEGLRQENKEPRRREAEEGGGQRRETLLSDLLTKENEAPEVEKLKSANVELQREIQSLQRTIHEQSMYLLQIERNGTGSGASAAAVVGLSLEPDSRTPVEETEQREEDDEEQDRARRQRGRDADRQRDSDDRRSPKSRRRQELGLFALQEEADEYEDDVRDGRSDVMTSHVTTESSEGNYLTDIRTGGFGGGKKKPSKDHFTGEEKRLVSRKSDEISMEDVERQELMETIRLVRKELDIRDETIRRLEESADELMNEVERRDGLEKECQTIVDDYRAFIRDFERYKNVCDLKTKADGTPFGEVRDWLSRCQLNEEANRRLKEDRVELQGQLEAARKALEQLEKDQTQELNSLGRTKNELETEVQRLNERLRKSEEDSVELKEEHEALVAERETVEKQRRQMSSQLDDFAKLTLQLESFRAENETLRCLLESKSPQLDGDYEERLLTKLDQLSETKEFLEEQLKDKEYELEETRDELLEQLDALRSKMEAEQRRAEREYSEIMDDQEQLLEENKKLQAKAATLERDLNDVQEMYSEERAAMDKSRDILDEEIERLRADMRTKTAHDTDVVSLCDSLTRKMEDLERELKTVTAERNQAVSQCKTFQVNHSDLERTHRVICDRISQLQLENEALSKTLDREKSAVQEINRRLSERLETLREENEKLVKENEKLGLILEMEKLKNFSAAAENQSTLASGEGQVEREREDKMEAKISRQTDSHSHEDEDQQMQEEIETLRGNNRKLALDVAEFHFRLSRKLLPLPAEEVDVVGPSGEHVTRKQRDDTQRILRDFALENLRHLQVMTEAEEKCDQLRKQIKDIQLECDDQDTGPSSSPGARSVALSRVVEVLRQENAKLKELLSLLESSMEEEEEHSVFVASSSVALHPPQRGPGPADVPRSEILLHGRVISPPPPPPPPLTQTEGDNSSAARIIQLQRKLQENDIRYRDIISSYRRHLLSSVQGTIDPEVKEALLRIIDLRRRDLRL